jgi:hypothetical protein
MPLLSKFARAMWILSWATITATLAVLFFSRTAPAAPAPDPAALVRDLEFAKFKGSYDKNKKYVPPAMQWNELTTGPQGLPVVWHSLRGLDERRPALASARADQQDARVAPRRGPRRHHQRGTAPGYPG